MSSNMNFDITYSFTFVKIRGDFILIIGDTISNMNLTEALQAHKEEEGSGHSHDYVCQAIQANASDPPDPPWK